MSNLGSWDIEVIARHYGSKDLEVLVDKCPEIASAIWELANLDLDRADGTMSRWLNKLSDAIEELGRVAYAAARIQEGKAVRVLYSEDGELIQVASR